MSLDWEQRRERERKRREISNKISKLEQEISKMRELVMTLQKSERQIKDGLESFSRAYQSYTGNPLAPDIFQKDVFEGMSAQQLAIDIPEAVQKLLNTAGQVSILMGGIQEQVRNIEEYINELRDEIGDLRAALAAL